MMNIYVPRFESITPVSDPASNPREVYIQTPSGELRYATAEEIEYIKKEIKINNCSGDAISREYLLSKSITLELSEYDKIECIPIGVVKSAPPVESKPKEAHWVFVSVDAGCAERICDHCGGEEPYKNAGKESEVYKFCPHCGYKMVKIKCGRANYE